jgi:hypothetical protein
MKRDDEISGAQHLSLLLIHSEAAVTNFQLDLLRYTVTQVIVNLLVAVSKSKTMPTHTIHNVGRVSFEDAHNTKNPGREPVTKALMTPGTALHAMYFFHFDLSFLWVMRCIFCYLIGYFIRYLPSSTIYFPRPHQGPLCRCCQ